MTRYYVDAQGKYVGGFDGAEPPAGSIEIPSAPENASDKWSNGAWIKAVELQDLTALQIRKVLNKHGLRATVEAAVANADQVTKDAWEFASSYKRNDPVLLAMAQVIGLDSATLDAMFIEGAAL